MHWQAAPIPVKPLAPSVLFHLENVSYTYPNGQEALRGVSLSFGHGEKIALVGQNGSGKTTLARMLCGLISPTQGRVWFEGRPVMKEDLAHLRRHVGLLFQDPDDHLFCTRLADDVAFGPLNAGVPTERTAAIVSQMLALMDLSPYAAKAPHHLSYGQRKRAALAAILACDPSVLILDEPTANLDSKNTEKLLEALHRFSGTLICISHDLMFLYGFCDRAVVLHRGSLHHDMDFHDFIAHRASLKEHGLDFSFRVQCCRHGHEGALAHDHDSLDHHSDDSRSAVVRKEPQSHGLSGAGSRQAVPPFCVMDRAAGVDHVPLLELHDYSYRYPDGTWGLRKVSLKVHDGERIALLGENGAGKSTLASVLLGIRTGRGLYRFQGQRVDKRVKKHLWRSVGMVFQDSMDQMVSASVWDEVAFGLKYLGVKDPELGRRVRSALDLVGLKGLEHRVPHQLSAGERKRLSLAAVLAMEPRVLILDEPTANLDPESEKRLLEILDELATTLILISHDICFVSSLTDRILLLHEGCLVQDLSTENFLMDDGLQSRYGLDVTYHNRCCRQILAMRDLEHHEHG
ncbi:ABC transporter ATP-binding protein [Desulfosoma caldarium]|uniref:Energy-coupling factor transport system ATP-binding protein n=1 Tax=Desulfosoma caldarium TaxID=610254 RepID=A0A3N1UYF9_9BACT|nr:ABC transporter ATP-binding protein [Desulfosoma caldarium]ROQ92326.1 energy-coupling factor transport system ATP-binding protein [Desulfosoma caldarium]